MAGRRNQSNGSIIQVGTEGYYWSSAVFGAYSRYLVFGSSFAAMDTYGRAFGQSVRCLKD
jgi:hypothetical protein